MIIRLTHTFIYVLKLDSAIDFYTKKLGFKIHADLIVNGDRWVTLHLPEQPELEILLLVVEEGMIFKSNQVKQMTQLIKAQTLSYGVFECVDVRAFYEEKNYWVFSSTLIHTITKSLMCLRLLFLMTVETGSG